MIAVRALTFEKGRASALRNGTDHVRSASDTLVFRYILMGISGTGFFAMYQIAVGYDGALLAVVPFTGMGAPMPFAVLEVKKEIPVKAVSRSCS